MSIFETLNLGSAPDANDGDDQRAGGTKLNNNIAKTPNLTEDNSYTGNQTYSGSGDITVALNSVTNSPYFELLKNSVSKWLIAMERDTPVYGVNANDFIIYNSVGAGSNFSIEVLTGYTNIPGVYDETTASAANVFVDTDGSLRRSTSSEKLKDEIQPISLEYSANIYEIAKQACIFYKSKCKADNPNYTHYGLSAEKLAEIDPRLIHLGYWPEDYEITGSGKNKKRELKKDAIKTPVGIQSQKIIPLMLVEMNRLNDKVNDLETRLSALENA